MTKKVNVKNEGENIPENFDFPQINIEEIDRAIFNLFDKEISFEVQYDGSNSKVPVVFASGERFALTRRKSPIRDNNNALILPIISISRGNFDISPGQNNLGTPIAPYYAQPYYIKHRLAESDRDYQNIINKMGIKNQDNVSSRNNFLSSDISPGNVARPGRFSSRRPGNGLNFINKTDKGITDSLGKNIYEIIEIPYPDFISTTYSVIFWTQYVQQANQMIETLMNRFAPYKELITRTKNGYEVFVDLGDSISSETNFDNYTDDERVIKHSFDIKVGGYLLALDNKNLGTPFKSYYSAPEINFGYYDSNLHVVKKEKNDFEINSKEKFILSDLQDYDSVKENLQRGQSSEEYEKYVENPFDNSKQVKFVKVKLKNQRAGETVASLNDVRKIDNQFEW